MQNKAQAKILEARDIKVYEYREANPAESFKTIASKKMFLDLKGNAISAQQLYNIYVKIGKRAVDKQPLTRFDMGDYNKDTKVAV